LHIAGQAVTKFAPVTGVGGQSVEGTV
jgi:hypothetical protein